MSVEEKAESIIENYVKILRFLNENYPQIIKEIGLGVSKTKPNPRHAEPPRPTTNNSGKGVIIESS